MIKIASCGWCKAKGLQTISNRGGGEGLENHKIPQTYRDCKGQATSPYFPTTKRQRQTAKVA